jgi:argininosuccinate lyase
MSGIARTKATGEGGMLRELVAWSSSYGDDLAFVREDLVGSAAHVTMLARTGLVPVDDARQLRAELLAMFARATAGELALPEGEEDVHMAVEAALTKALGPRVAGKLHTARSRNDQVALDLRLFVRREATCLLDGACALAREIVDRAEGEQEVLLPAYTHRQRAQPISAAFLLCAWASDLLRAARTIVFALGQADELPLGSGACSGTSLPIDREMVRRLLGFGRFSRNALDVVGDRGFVLDYTWAASRVLLSLGKMASDLVDYSTSEFGLVRLGGQIAAGSSMMPQKKNPDVFELVRGKSARGVANVVGMLTLVKGLPSGYNRDQQEDRRSLLEAGPLARGALAAVRSSLPHVTFDGARGMAALADGFTQATDLAEALVGKGVPFREAYGAVGALVRLALDEGRQLAAIALEDARRVHAAFDAEALAALDPRSAVSRKEIPGGTGPQAVRAQMDSLRAEVRELEKAGAPELDSLAERIESEPLEVRT